MIRSKQTTSMYTLVRAFSLTSLFLERFFPTNQKAEPTVRPENGIFDLLMTLADFPFSKFLILRMRLWTGQPELPFSWKELLALKCI